MEPLKDPLCDRTVVELIPPPHLPLSSELLFDSKDLPNIEVLKRHFHSEGRVSKTDALKIIEKAARIFRSEQNLVHLTEPVTIVGDIHGQYYDLVNLLEIGGDVSNRKYLFLGDYVDRGSFSLECILLLYAIKINYPKKVVMIRGNHECRQLTSFFNFRAECLNKQDIEVYDFLMESFDWLPLACVVNGKFLAIHGGISPHLKSLQDINSIGRHKEPPRNGLFCDLLWSDPVDHERGLAEKRFRPNKVRGCSCNYGVEETNSFLEENNILSILRAHEAQLEGYKMHSWNGTSEFPAVITLFSAPNYCDVYNNKGAIIKLENNKMNIHQYNYTQHPYILPNFMDIFSWSIPFVIEKVLEMVYRLIKPSKNEKVKLDSTFSSRKEELEKTVRSAKMEKLRNKVIAVSKMIKMFRLLREEEQMILELKGLCPDNKIPRGLLQEGRKAITTKLEAFNKAKEWDIVNEKRPEMSF